MKKIFCALLSLLLVCAALFGCGPLSEGEESGGPEGGTPPPAETDPPEGGSADSPAYAADDYLKVDLSRLFGVAEPFLELQEEDRTKFQVKGFDKDVAAGHLGELHVATLRFMIPQSVFARSICFEDGETDIEFDEEAIGYLHDCIRALSDAGVKHLIGEAALYPRPEGFFGGYPALSVPSRSEEVYQNWLILLSEMWAALAEEFPEIAYWEMGNEVNSYSYLRPITGQFDLTEQAAITTDLMYYAAKGIRKGNPNAFPVTPGFTSLGSMTPYSDSLTNAGFSIAVFLEQIYKNIASGAFPYGDPGHTDIEDYFVCVAYHPYEYVNWSGWVEGNERVFGIMDRYDDPRRKVLFTEVGWPDNHEEATEEAHETRVIELYERCAALERVETACYFRLYDCEYAAMWGGVGETSFGLFREPSGEDGEFVLKGKGRALRDYFGTGAEA